VSGDQLYTAVDGVISVRNTAFLDVKTELARLDEPIERFTILDSEHLCIQTVSEGSHGRKEKVHILKTQTGEITAISGAEEHSWVQAVHNGELYFTSHSQGTETCTAYNWLACNSRVVIAGKNVGKPVFGVDGVVKYFINRSHCGPQTVHDSQFRLVHEANPSNILQEIDAATGNILERRYHSATGRWLPWVIKRSEFESSEKCIWSACPGNIRHFHHNSDFSFFNVRMPDDSIMYSAITHQPTVLGNDIKHILTHHLNGKEVISGPEFKELSNLRAWNLVAVDSAQQLYLLQISCNDDGQEQTVTTLLFQL
jgi:hypothetical protein